LAEFEMNVQFVTVGLEVSLYIPPPSVAAFDSNVQSSMVRFDVKLEIPPPKVAEPDLNVQLVTEASAKCR
jgi:hypothetical protein